MEEQDTATSEGDERSDSERESSPIPSADPSAHYSTHRADTGTADIAAEDVNIKDEPPSPAGDESSVSAAEIELGLVSPPPASSSHMSLEAKLGVPDDAPLKVQRSTDDGKISYPKPLSEN